jgi:hypothetical protein
MVPCHKTAAALGELYCPIFLSTTSFTQLFIATAIIVYTISIRVIQVVSEISALILTGNRTHQKEQLFSLPCWRKTLRNGLKK